jgi:aspartyl-tRNA(Asn)/glutamyl-tRNA(Gln) amidotransferase subunit C
MGIDREQVRKVAHLARLDLTEDEEMQFCDQLSSILDYFEQMSELDTENVPPTARAIDTSNVTRTDRLETSSERDDMLASAPDREEDFFKVPQIFQEGE